MPSSPHSAVVYVSNADSRDISVLELDTRDGHSTPVETVAVAGRVMPLAVSITEGVAFGVVAYVILKVATGRRDQVHPLLYVFALLFVARYAFLRG